jgi:phosphoglycerate-specific signal transduction histidine kinase
MDTKYSPPKIEDVYSKLAKIIKNDDNIPLEQMGSLIVGCTLAQDDIELLFRDYPVLEEIAEIGADMEWQAGEFLDEYNQQLHNKMKVLQHSIHNKSLRP